MWTNDGRSSLFQYVFIALTFIHLSSSQQNSICKTTQSLVRNRVVSHLAVVTHNNGQDIEWIKTLPIPVVVYSSHLNTIYHYHGISDSSAYVKYIIDHFECLPHWTLFLSGSMKNHPLNPATSSALLDLNQLDRGYLAVGHLLRSSEVLRSMHPASEGFSAAAPHQNHRVAYVATEEGRIGCECFIMRKLLSPFPGVGGSLNFDSQLPPQCDRPFSWQPGSVFWASGRRIHSTPVELWKHVLEVLDGDEEFEVEETGQKSSFAAECVEAVWHFLLGEPLYHFTPRFESFEELPLISRQARCDEAHTSTCSSPPPPPPLSTNEKGENTQSSTNRNLCAATHGEMDGDEVGVARWTGSSAEHRDHSCCFHCRAVEGCEFWVRSTTTSDCWLRKNFRGYTDTSNRRGAFVNYH